MENTHKQHCHLRREIISLKHRIVAGRVFLTSHITHAMPSRCRCLIGLCFFPLFQTMGNTRSSFFEQKQDDSDVWWSNSATNEVEVVDPVVVNETKNRYTESDRKLDEFKLELTEKRKEIINRKIKEMDELREEIRRLKQENNALRRNQTVSEENEAIRTTQAVSGKDDTEEIQRLKEEIEALRRVQAISGKNDCDTLNKISLLEQENETLKMVLGEKDYFLVESEKIIEKNRELRIETVRMQQELQRLNNEMNNFERERADYKAHVVALKDVIAVSKNMLQIRETELTEVSSSLHLQFLFLRKKFLPTLLSSYLFCGMFY